MEPTVDTVRQTFDTWAEEGHGERMAKGHWPTSRQILEKMPLKPGDSFLDIGCGNGYLVAKASERVGATGHVYGVDIAPQMVRLAQQTYPHLACGFDVAPVSDLPFQTASMDAVTAIESLYYWPDMAQGLSEVFRVLKPGGWFAAMVDYYQENPYCAVWGELMPVAMAFLSEQDYQKEFEAAGFCQIRLERLFNPEPVNPMEFKPGWGYETPEDVEDFRQRVGSLAIWGQKTL